MPEHFCRLLERSQKKDSTKTEPRDWGWAGTWQGRGRMADVGQKVLGGGDVWLRVGVESPLNLCFANGKEAKLPWEWGKNPWEVWTHRRRMLSGLSLFSCSESFCADESSNLWAPGKQLLLGNVRQMLMAFAHGHLDILTLWALKQRRLVQVGSCSPLLYFSYFSFPFSSFSKRGPSRLLKGTE